MYADLKGKTCAYVYVTNICTYIGFMGICSNNVLVLRFVTRGPKP